MSAFQVERQEFESPISLLNLFLIDIPLKKVMINKQAYQDASTTRVFMFLHLSFSTKKQV